MKYYVADAFAERVFEGNPAGVCVLNEWIPEELMKKIAMENNLAETAFTVKTGDSYSLRWFTPGGEIDLCGHATLATAFILCNYYEKESERILFQTKGGELEVVRKKDLYEMDFPAYSMRQVPVTDDMEEAIGFRPVEAWMGRDLVCVLEQETMVLDASPKQEKVKELMGLLLHITAKSKQYDCVSRTFAPKLNVAEDAVCGSGHCHLIPLWSEKLGKKELTARQESRRGGTLFCRLEGSRVKMAGHAVIYSESELFLEPLIQSDKNSG